MKLGNKLAIIATLIIVFAGVYGHQGNILAAKDTNNRQTFDFKYDYNDLYSYLGIDAKQFNFYRSNGKSIVEIARENGISEYELIIYFGEKMFEKLDEHLKQGEIDKYFYYDYAINHMGDSISEFINHKRNHKENILKVFKGNSEHWEGTIKFVEENNNIKCYTSVSPINIRSSKNLKPNINTILNQNLRPQDVNDLQILNKVNSGTINVEWKENEIYSSEKIILFENIN